ncbi:MAG: efflux RND transporter periplasmic adaptor subunit [Kiritimatiellae bacterium]|nr:efflux RND transporter periplasmic adaptor subunit [Kiritimatiellia bacterium]
MMKSPILPLFVLGACLAGAVCAQEEEAAEEIPAVAVSRPVRLKEGPPRSWVGTVKAAETVSVTARVTGEILRRGFAEGGAVEKGQVLFVLEDTVYRAALASAEAEVARLRTQLAFAEKEAVRYRSCLGESGVSEADCELKEQERDVLRADLAAAEARRTLAEDDLAHTRVASPVAGRVGEALVGVGNVVSPESGPLATVVAGDPARVRFALAERDYYGLFGGGVPGGAGAAVRVSVVRADGRVLDDRPVAIDFADNEADPRTGTVALRATVPNADGALLPGGYVRVVLAERFAEPRLAVPVGALVFEGGAKHVYVLDAEDRAVLRAVGDGPQAGDLQVLGEGFAATDRIVTGGIHKVRPGGRVVPVEREVPCGRSDE